MSKELLSRFGKKGLLAVAACFLCELTAVGIGAGTNSLYTAPICQDLEISRTAYSVSTALIYLVNMAVYFSFPLLLRRIPLRGIFLLGFGAEAAAFLLYSQAGNVGVLCVSASLLGIGLVFLGAVPITTVVTSWFPQRAGTMLGIVLAGSGIGGAVLIPGVGIVMEQFGWRNAFLVSAGLVTFTAVLCLAFLQANPQNKPPAEKEPRISLLSSLRIPGISWALVYGFLAGFSIQPTYLSIAAHLAEQGISSQKASQVLGAICLVSLIAKVILGAVSDRFGPLPVLACSHGGFVLAAVALVFFPQVFLPTEVFFGFGSLPLSLVLPILTNWLFHEKSSQALSLCMAAQTAGISVGILMAGGAFDLFGGYEEIFLFLGAVNFLAFLALLLGQNNRIKGK